jgi:hypothetical protein
VKKLYIAAMLLICFLLAALQVFAHPGRTDENGGHYVGGTSEYHYHHGYPAHNHYDMDGDGDKDCPYNFDDKTGWNSGNSTTNKTTGSYSSSYTTPKATTSSTPIKLAEPQKNNEEKDAGQISAWSIVLFIILALAVVCLADSLYKSKKELEKSEDIYRKVIAEKEKEIKANIAILHEALIKKYGKDYLFVISGAPPGDYVGPDMLPHSASYLLDKTQDKYTLFLGGYRLYSSKVHHRSCRYACMQYPVNAYFLKKRGLHQFCSLCPCKLPDTEWVDQFQVLYDFMKKYVDIDLSTEEKEIELKEDKDYGKLTYDFVSQKAHHMGVDFGTAMKLINRKRASLGLEPVYFQERTTCTESNAKINWRD